ncbi:MAG: hypothetical protein WCG26_04625 [Chloroflexales bacterium]
MFKHYRRPLALLLVVANLTACGSLPSAQPAATIVPNAAIPTAESVAAPTQPPTVPSAAENAALPTRELPASTPNQPGNGPRPTPQDGRQPGGPRPAQGGPPPMDGTPGPVRPTPADGQPPARPAQDAQGAQGGAAAGNQTQPGPGTFTMDQTLSEQAQQTTIAFDGLAFLTGNLGSDSFFPPGKVADFWGFQFLRDNDPSAMGHNTDFLTNASLNMLHVLTSDQQAQLITLAKSQVDAINTYGTKRFVLMSAFRRLLEADLPTGTSGLNETAVKAFSAELYRLDGEISFARAQVMGGMLHNLSAEQRATLATMVGQGMTTWPKVDEPDVLRGLSRDEKVAVMTYAGDLFSWYAGSVEADVYFCPERQGTYFGSFYMKDAPAVGNPGYSIGTTITADMGNAFIAALTPDQAQQITGLVETQRPALTDIVAVRTKIATELRKFIAGETADSATVLALMETYGALDGTIVYHFATNFVRVGQTLTDAQHAQLQALRQQTLGDFTPKAAFLYAEPIDFPTVPNTDFLFS